MCPGIRFLRRGLPFNYRTGGACAGYFISAGYVFRYVAGLIDLLLHKEVTYDF